MNDIAKQITKNIKGKLTAEQIAEKNREIQRQRQEQQKLIEAGFDGVRNLPVSGPDVHKGTKLFFRNFYRA